MAAWRLAAAAAAAAAPVALACSCVSPSEGACGLAKGAEAIFTGRVIAEKKTSESATTYTFSVNELFRATPAQIGTNVDVWTAAHGASCGADFGVGVEYLVFAHLADGRYATSLCSGNRPVAEAGAELRYLRRTGQDALAKGAAAALPGFLFGSVTNREADLKWRSFGQATWPVAGAKVRALHSSGAVVAETMTGSDGGYEFFNLPPARYRVEVDGPRGTFTARPGEEFAAVQPGACIARSFFRAKRVVLKGRLIDSDGEADSASDAFLEPVGLEAPPPLPGDDSELETDSDEKGEFQFEVPPGKYRLGARQFGYNDVVYYPDELALTGDAPPVRIRFQLPRRPEKQVQGVVVDGNGRPVEGIKVWLRGRMEDGAVVSGSIHTPESGRIVFHELAVIDYELTAEEPNGRRVTVKVPAGQREEARLVLPRRR